MLENLKVLEQKFETAQDELHRRMQAEYEKLGAKLASEEEQLKKKQEKFLRETNNINGTVCLFAVPLSFRDDYC